MCVYSLYDERVKEILQKVLIHFRNTSEKQNTLDKREQKLLKFGQTSAKHLTNEIRSAQIRLLVYKSEAKYSFEPEPILAKLEPNNI